MLPLYLIRVECKLKTKDILINNLHTLYLIRVECKLQIQFCRRKKRLSLYLIRVECKLIPLTLMLALRNLYI